MEISGVSVQERWLSIYSVMEIEAACPPSRAAQARRAGKASPTDVSLESLPVGAAFQPRFDYGAGLKPGPPSGPEAGLGFFTRSEWKIS